MEIVVYRIGAPAHPNHSLPSICIAWIDLAPVAIMYVASVSEPVYFNWLINYKK